jgi:hypothetical protein
MLKGCGGPDPGYSMRQGLPLQFGRFLQLLVQPRHGRRLLSPVFCSRPGGCLGVSCVSVFVVMVQCPLLNKPCRDGDCRHPGILPVVYARLRVKGCGAYDVPGPVH